ncbi:hypothetical protein [Chitinophaga dinghuensis]|nr:hypothetical protein [Chitinophaga dinghuensis]
MSSCTSMKLAVPEAFKQQATMHHVNGARGNKMSFANFKTSKIKRGVHVIYPNWGRGHGFFLENLVLHRMGIEKSETVENEKTRFRYSLSDGNNQVNIYANEMQVTVKHEYNTTNYIGIFSSFEKLQQYNYVFSAVIRSDSAQDSRDWELVMTNLYDRQAQRDNNPFTFISREDKGLATNGQDTIFVKPLSIRKTETTNGKPGKLPFKVMSGYELSTSGGVIGIIDMIDRNVWFYNELDNTEKLHLTAIATALFARKVHDVKW